MMVPKVYHSLSLSRFLSDDHKEVSLFGGRKRFGSIQIRGSGRSMRAPTGKFAPSATVIGKKEAGGIFATRLALVRRSLVINYLNVFNLIQLQYRSLPTTACLC